MAGIAMLLFFEDGTSVSAVSAEVYRLVASPTLPAIPLLTACGYILAETKAAERLVRFFRALFGWMPGGIALLAVAVCAVFTTFTGGSGVTIIALGGLVYGIMREDGYPEGFSQGLITASGSLGLLFPPSLPVILYAVVVSASPEFKVAADDLYIAGLVPGMLLIVLVAAWGIFVGKRLEKTSPEKKPRTPFNMKELAASAWGAKWELSVPFIVIALFVSGIASMVEAAASAAAYALFIEVVITKDIHPTRDLPEILVKAGVLVGAVLILLSAAMGLSSFVLVEAEVPEKLLGWVKTAITEPWVFLLALNVLLIVLGCLMEIYSAIVILPPILAPIAAHYGIDPLHLGVIFLANLELGFISPPVGLNLFLAASRFEIPMVKLYRHVVPYLLIMGGGVLLITYVPAMSKGVVEWLKPAKTAPKPSGQREVPKYGALAWKDGRIQVPLSAP
jgi:tripartite ATP-independent transporter DctM subunit